MSAKGDVSVIPTPHFNKYLIVILTDGDSGRYSFTITNIGNETIKGQKLWFDLKTPSGKYYNPEACILPELKPGENTTSGNWSFFLEEVGVYILKCGINSEGNKDSPNSVPVNGRIDSRNAVFNSFHTYDRNQLVNGIILAIIGSIVAYMFLKAKK